jgi:hypothetical protein
MSTTISSNTAAPRLAIARNEAPASNVSTSNVASQPANGNSSVATQPVDQITISARASALSTNDSIHRVLSDIVGPRNDSGNSGLGSWLTLGESSPQVNSSVSNDPAAAYRSTEKVALEGYDQAKLENPDHRTPKYLFGRVAQGFSLESLGGDKAKAEALLTAMVPDLKKAGLEVVSVQGDRIQVKTELGYEWVDVIRASGAAKGEQGWQWLSTGKGTAQPTKDFKEFCQQTGHGMEAAAPASVPASQSGAAAPQAAGAAPSAAMAAGPKATPLGDQIDKNKVLPVLQKYNVLDIEKAVNDPEIQKAYPGAKVIPHPKRLDKIQFPNGAVVDCVVAAGDPSASWGWMPEN